MLLQFWYHARYPILDYRALWSLGVEEPPAYDFEFWWGYIEFYRALWWQFSKDKQGRRGQEG